MELLGWEWLSEHIQSQFPVLIPMGGMRGAAIGCDPSIHRLFLRLPSEAGDLPPASPYADLHIEAKRNNTKSIIEIFTTSPHLFKEFHRFAELLTESEFRTLWTVRVCGVRGSGRALARTSAAS